MSALSSAHTHPGGAPPQAEGRPPKRARVEPGSTSTPINADASLGAVLSACQAAQKQWSALLQQPQKQAQHVGAGSDTLPTSTPLSACLLDRLPSVKPGEAPAARFPLLPTLCVALDCHAVLGPFFGVPSTLHQHPRLLVLAAGWLVRALQPCEQALLAPHTSEVFLLLSSVASIELSNMQQLGGMLGMARQLAGHAALQHPSRPCGQEAAAAGTAEDQQLPGSCAPQAGLQLGSISGIRAQLLARCGSTLCAPPVQPQQTPQQAQRAQQAQQAQQPGQPAREQPPTPLPGAAAAVFQWSSHAACGQLYQPPQQQQQSQPQRQASCQSSSAACASQVALTPVDMRLLRLLRQSPAATARVAHFFASRRPQAAGTAGAAGTVPGAGVSAAVAPGPGGRVCTVTLTPVEQQLVRLLHSKPAVARRFAQLLCEGSASWQPKAGGLPAAQAAAATARTAAGAVKVEAVTAAQGPASVQGAPIAVLSGTGSLGWGQQAQEHVQRAGQLLAA